MSSNKTIAKNTLFLYFRMFFNMGVSLYTSRVVLQVLGVDDFGIFNVVGGVVVLFSFLNGSMSAATQRFINVEKASGVVERVKKIFNISVVNHLLIALAILVLAETFGLWFLNAKLNIPPERMYAANWVYQLSVLTTIIHIIRVPFNSIILAFERMSYYAYLGIFETLSKLGVVLLLLVVSGQDNLILYSILFMAVSLVTTLIYYFYCKRNFREETRFKFYKDLSKTKEVVSFSGWALLGQGAVVASTQGVNVVLNMFIGVTVNAAMAVANQVSSALYSFVGNAQVAFQPQIVQSYAEKNIDRHLELVMKASRFSFFLMAIIAFPFILSIDIVFEIWLGNSIPDYSIAFTQITIFSFLINALAGPFWMSAYAVGNIKKYQVYIAVLTIVYLPISILMLYFSIPVEYVLLTKVMLDAGILVFRVWYLKSTMYGETIGVYDFIKRVLPIALFIVSSVLLINYLAIESRVFLISVTAVLEILLFAQISFFGVNQEEKLVIIRFLKSKIK